MARIQLEGILKLIDVDINPAIFQKISRAVSNLPIALQQTGKAASNAQNQMNANQAYNDYNLNQQKLKQQAEDDAYNRRLAGLNGLSGLSKQALGTKPYENIISHENGILDYATAGANIASAGANVVKALPFL